MIAIDLKVGKVGQESMRVERPAKVMKQDNKMIHKLRSIPRATSRLAYHSVSQVVDQIERDYRIQEQIFPGWDHLVLANIHTLKPKPGQKPIEIHDYEWYSEQLKKHGHLIIKNTGIKEPRDFKEWHSLFAKQFKGYDGGESNREEIGSGVLNVNTFEPPEIDIAPHIELVYQDSFPERIAFCCFEQSEKPGITMLYDNRKISKHLPQRLKQKLMTHGFRVYHVYQNLQALRSGKEPFWYNTWQESYKVETKEQIIEVMERQNYEYEFLKNDRLKASKTLSAVHYHEGELYFLHGMVGTHTSYFQFIPGLKKYPMKERPFYTTWGNGEELSTEDFNEFVAVDTKYQLAVNYEEGDIFLIDNIKFKHGRTPYQGKRKVGVLMGNPVSRKISP